MAAAIERDRDAQRALLAADVSAAQTAFGEAAVLYRQSWEAAPPKSYGRLVGMLKSAVLAGDGRAEAQYARHVPGDDGAGSPTAAYAQALAALIDGDDDDAQDWALQMRGGSDAFDRTADAIAALAARDQAAYAAALRAIVHDFEQRADHLTGVAIADTALMLERLAARRGMAAGVESALLPGNPLLSE
jgi:hypothetical protein